MIFSGFLIDVKSIFTSLQWIRWFSAFRYSTNLLSINEFQGLVFCRSNETNHCFLTGEQVLTQQDIPHQTDWHFWSNYLALLLMILVSLLLSYIQLVRMKKTKWIREESTDSHRDCLSSQVRSISINLLVHRVRLNSVQRRITQQERLLGQCRSVLVWWQDEKKPKEASEKETSFSILTFYWKFLLIFRKEEAKREKEKKTTDWENLQVNCWQWTIQRSSVWTYFQ